MLEKINSFFEKNSKIYLYISIVLCAFLSFLLFNINVSVGGDDSDYIEGAWKFLKGTSFPSGHGSFYPIFLSLFISIFGIKLFLLKLLSLFCIVFHLYLFYKSFKNKIPTYILFLGVIFISVNSFILIFASLTYSEALYFALQICSIYYLYMLIDNLNKDIAPLKLWKNWLILGFFMFLLFNTRNIGIAFVIAIVIYFLIYKRWISAIIGLISFLIFQIPFSLYQKIVWGSSNIMVSGTYGGMFLKDSYSPDQGNETLGGFIVRFITNAHQFISYHLLSFLGIDLGNSAYFSIFISLIFIAVFFFALWKYIKNNMYFGFIGIYMFIALCATFLSQQVFWSQGRLVIIYLPLIFVYLFYWLHEITSKKKNLLIKTMPLAIGIIFIILVLFDTASKVKENLPVLSKNLSGDKYYGFTEDWQNYIKLSEWCSTNLPKEAGISCRYPTMSFIYGNGREFSGIYQCPVIPVDSFLNAAREKPSILVFNPNEIRSKLSKEDQIIFRQNLWALLMRSKSGLGIILLNPSNKDLLITKISKFKLLHTFSYDTLSYLAKYEPCTVIYPDTLLEKLHSKNIEYVIDAKINANEWEGNKQLIINTVKRYISFIVQKYPSLIELVRVEGQNNPASLYKIHWEKINSYKEN